MPPLWASSGFFTQNTKTLQRPIICPNTAASLWRCQEKAALFVKFAGSYGLGVGVGDLSSAYIEKAPDCSWSMG